MKRIYTFLLLLCAAGIVKAADVPTGCSGTLPVLFINTSEAADVPACCTYEDGYYFAYFENSQQWTEVGCYVWDDSDRTIAGSWPGEKCELVGTAANGNQIWRWKSQAPASELDAPKHIIFNSNENVSGIQTVNLTFTNGGYYTYSMQKDASPEVRITATGAVGKAVPIVSKEEYVAGTYYIDALGLQGYESLGSEAKPLPLQIRGRGNYTWKDFDKKPYRLKFDKKASPLGMNKSKHFVLLAHADDNMCFLRNTVGFELSRQLGLAYTPEQRPVEVVLNGDYIGLYMLNENIRVDADRVNITEQADEETITRPKCSLTHRRTISPHSSRLPTTPSMPTTSRAPTGNTTSTSTRWHAST